MLILKVAHVSNMGPIVPDKMEEYMPCYIVML